MSDPLKSLIEIISSQTSVLQDAYTKTGASVASIDDPFQHSPLEFDPSVNEARQLIVAAATQLIATVQSPFDFMQVKMGGATDTVIMGFLVDVNVPEIVKEGGAQGVHVDEISKLSGVESSYLGRVLRYMATRHIFKEMAPNVFAHNRLSSVLTKSKSLKEIQEHPDSRYENAMLAVFSQISSDELFNSLAALPTFMKNPKQAASPFNLAYKTDKSMWTWFEEHENDVRTKTFIAALNNSFNDFPPELFTSAIDVSWFKPNDTVVDVAGGAGSLTFTIKNAFPQLRYVVQDLAKSISGVAEKFWNEKDPEAIKTGQVQLQAYDFFTPQPIKNASVYLLRYIIHNWPDEKARKILTNIRSAAGPNSKLILFEVLAKHVTDNHTTANGVPREPPYPLLPNFGIVGAGSSTGMDMMMLTMYNGKERTYEEYLQLGKETGWKLEKVVPGELSALIFSTI